MDQGQNGGDICGSVIEKNVPWYERVGSEAPSSVAGRIVGSAFWGADMLGLGYLCDKGKTQCVSRYFVSVNLLIYVVLLNFVY